MSLNQLHGFLCALRTYCNHFLRWPLSPGPPRSLPGHRFSPGHAQPAFPSESMGCACCRVGTGAAELRPVPCIPSRDPLASKRQRAPAPLHPSRVCSWCCDPQQSRSRHTAYLNSTGRSAHPLPNRRMGKYGGWGEKNGLVCFCKGTETIFLCAHQSVLLLKKKKSKIPLWDSY